jgi:curved DNA-binding protein CbpA
MDAKGYYAVLGVSEHASYHEIKRAYRRLARKYHPDRNNSSFAEDMIKNINRAFEILSDETKRKEYDGMYYENGPQNVEEQVQHSAQARPGTSGEKFDFHHDNVRARNYAQATITQFLDLPKGRFHVSVEPSLCMAYGTCERIAPRVFLLDKNKMINPKAKVESEIGADFETLLAAAHSFPTKAIKIVDRYTGEQIYP